MCSNGTTEIVCWSNCYCLTHWDILINVALTLVGFVIMSLNSWILWILFTRREKLEQTHQFIANLAVSDLLIGLFVCYDVVYNILQFKIFVECVLREGFFIAVNLASVWTLAVQTFDRYFKIQHPFKYIRHFSKGRVRKILAVLWIVAFVIGSCPFFGWNTEDILQICNFFGTMEQSYITFVIVLFTMPFMIMLFAYIRIAKTSLAHLKAIRSLECHSREVASSRHPWKAVKMAVIIVGAYVICWSPVGIFILIVYTTNIKEALSPRMSENVIFTYLLGIGIFNSVLNPLIYATNLELVRKSVRNSWLASCCRKMYMKKSPSSVTRISQETGSTRVLDH